VESCGWVYMDGTETHGSSSVTVITKYGRHTRFTFFEVWAPHIPVDVVLSDTVLEQVKGWKVPGRPESRYSESIVVYWIVSLILFTLHDTIRYDTIEEINVDSKAEYTA